MKQLIVNADDFGLTEGVSHGILDAHRYGLVTSTTLMANGAAFNVAVGMSRHSPDLGIGVHLNLTQGTPVSPACRIPSLVNARGQLHLTPGRLWMGIVTRQVSLREIETELRAQIAKVLEAGIAPTHLDGHKHVHILPGVADIVIHLAQEFGILSVRCPAEDAPGLLRLAGFARGAWLTALKQYFVARGVTYLAGHFRQMLTRAALASPAHFFGLSETGFLDEATLAAVLCCLPDGRCELMCHPGYPDLNLWQAGTRLLQQRQTELRALTSAQVRRVVAVKGIQLIGYRQLAGSPQTDRAA
jgi:chitin disaccharide deacetylase